MIPTEPISVADRSFSELLLAMSKTGFQGRKLGEAFRIWLEMLSDDVTIIMGLSGAMVAGGMRRIIAWLIERRFVDVIVSTGANIYHDILEAIGFRHYIGSECADDYELFRRGVDRIYNVFVREEDLKAADKILADVISEIDGVMSSRQLIAAIAERVAEIAKDESFVVAAYESGVPVFCPAIADSSVGIAAVLAEKRPIVDTMRDIEELTRIVAESKKTGVIFIGGGVPKNFIQQAEIVARLKGYDVAGHSYAIQITTDVPQFGGLSGATLEEAVSWGKIGHSAKKVQVNVDATIALPLLAHALRNEKRRSAPRVDRFFRTDR